MRLLRSSRVRRLPLSGAAALLAILLLASPAVLAPTSLAAQDSSAAKPANGANPGVDVGEVSDHDPQVVRVRP